MAIGPSSCCLPPRVAPTGPVARLTPRPEWSTSRQSPTLTRWPSRNRIRAAPGAGGKKFRAINKLTGEIIYEMDMPANVTGVPMTYMLDGTQYIAMPVGAIGAPAELIALKVP